MKRSRLFHIKRRASPGAAPGTMIAPAAARRPVIDIIAYEASGFVESNNVSLAEVSARRDHNKVTWVNVSGLGDAELISGLGEIFGLHRLAMEDVMNIHQRPKVEEFEDHLFVVTRMIDDQGGPDTEQVCMFLGKDYLLTFQETPGDCFDPVRDRIRKGKGRTRGVGADYLCYALIDAVVDDYFPVLESYGESLEQLEDEVVTRPESRHIARLHDMKRELLTLRRAIWPHREMINAIIRDDVHLITRDTEIYLRDVYDHTIQLMDIVETYREIASGLVDVYISSVSARLNEIMKVLTIIATIFIPLSFVASLYGMNFDRSLSAWNMPELGWRFGYPLALGLMAVIAVGLLAYFRRSGWIGTSRRAKRE